MDSRHESLLEAFEEFELDLEVEEILEKVKEEWVLDRGVTEFGEQLEEERKRLRRVAQAAQAARASYVRQHWTPSCYPQLTTDWFIEGLDFCCPYWRYQFKRPLTPPPAPPPSPDASQTDLPLHLPRHETPPPRQTKKTTTTMTLTTNWRSSGPKKSDDGRSDGLPEPGTGYRCDRTFA